MNKTINIIQTLAVCYGLALGFVFLVGMLDYHNPYVIFGILPLAYVIAIYEFAYIKEAKQAYNEHTALLKYDNKELSKQIENYKILDNARITRIDKLDKEITELKGDISLVAKGEMVVAVNNTGDIIKNGTPVNIIPFNEDNDSKEELHICCGREMREAKTMYICDRCKKRKIKPKIKPKKTEVIV